MARHGPDADRNVTHADCVESITEYITEEDLNNIILVGHSFGGTVIQKVAEAIPDRIKRLVFHNAIVLKDGNSTMDEFPPELQDLFDQLADHSDGNDLMLPFPLFREVFANDADLETAQWAYEHLSPALNQPFLNKMDVSSFSSLEIPRSNLNATEDTVMPQTPEWGWHPHFSSRLGVFRLVQMPGSHAVILTNPDGVANKYVEAGRD